MGGCGGSWCGCGGWWAALGVRLAGWVEAGLGDGRRDRGLGELGGGESFRTQIHDSENPEHVPDNEALDDDLDFPPSPLDEQDFPRDFDEP